MSAHYFNPQEMINKTIIFDERPAASVASSFHVAYGIDKNFLFDMELVNTGRRVRNPLQHKDFRRFQNCRHRPQQTRKYQVRTRLEIV